MKNKGRYPDGGRGHLEKGCLSPWRMDWVQPNEEAEKHWKQREQYVRKPCVWRNVGTFEDRREASVSKEHGHRKLSAQIGYRVQGLLEENPPFRSWKILGHIHCKASHWAAHQPPCRKPSCFEVVVPCSEPLAKCTCVPQTNSEIGTEVPGQSKPMACGKWHK